MKNKYFTLDEDFATIMRNALKNKKVISINPISTGWTNMVFEVCTDKGDFFFRFPRNNFWVKALVKDAKFTQFIYNKTDFNTVKLDLLYDKDRPFSIHRKLEGETLADKIENLTSEELQIVATDIAKFIIQLQHIKINENDEWPQLPDFLDELVCTFFSAEDKMFWNCNDFSDKTQRCLVHGDLNLSNILIDENNHVAAFLDFGFAGFGDKYSDIARVISRNCPKNYKEEIIKQYEMFSNQKLESDILNEKIDTWKKIDQGYIHYMKGNCEVCESV